MSRFCLTFKDLALTAVAFVTLALSTAFAAAPSQKVVRIGWYPDLYNCISTNGTRSGYVYDFAQTIASYTGWTYEYVEGDWGTLLEKLQNGEVDLVGGVSYSEERARTIAYSALPTGQEKHYLYAYTGENGVSAADLTSLNGKRIGILEGSLQIPLFKQWQKHHGVKPDMIYAANADTVRAGVAEHRFDGFISTQTPFWESVGMVPVTSIGSTGIYFGLNKNRPDLKRDLDAAMQQMETDLPFFANDLAKRYQYSSLTAAVDSDERDWLQTHGPIRIGHLRNDPGVSSLHPEMKTAIGVLYDYIKAAQTSLSGTSIRFETAAFDTQSDLIDALKNHRIDMIFHFSHDLSLAETEGFLLSQPVLTHPLSVVTAQIFFDESAPNLVAVARGNLLTKAHITQGYPTWQFLEVDSDADAERAVLNGEASCFVPSAGLSNPYSDHQSLHRLFLMQPDTVSFAVTRNNTRLLSILNKTLKTLSPTMLTSRWAMYRNIPKNSTLLDFIRDNPVTVALALVLFLLTLELLRRSKASETASRELNTQLKTAVQKAKAADEAKTRFLFNMSHDIRTPMNALLGYARMMKSELTDPKLLAYQQKMEQAGELLLSIINNVLDMARIESGRVEVEKRPCRVKTIFDDLIEVFELPAQEKGLQLLMHCDTPHPVLLCDTTKIKEIVTNLLSNAVKYTPAGGKVTVAVTETPAGEASVLLKIVVSDTGIGISTDYLGQIFEPFSRERNTTASKIAGTGLGMAIVKKLTDMMAGTVTVKSVLNQGTEVTVILPCPIGAQPTAPRNVLQPTTVYAERLRGQRVLLAEDNDLNAEIALFMLENLGIRADRVSDGKACVERLKTLPAQTYAAVLMDIQMPGMNGYEATRAIRAMKDPTKAQIPIVAMTANAFEEDKADAAAAGMNGHVAKPVNPESIAAALSAVL